MGVLGAGGRVVTYHRCERVGNGGRRCVLPDNHRGMHIYRPLLSRTARARSRARNLATVRQARSEVTLGRCEVLWNEQICTGDAVHLHHVHTRAQGGTDDPANLKGTCWNCHQAIHANPDEARRRGLLGRPVSSDPFLSALSSQHACEKGGAPVGSLPLGDRQLGDPA